MHRRWFVCLLTVAPLLCGRLSLAAEPKRMTWTVDGVEREAIVYVPDAAKTTDSPLIFGFHGHGGTMRYASKTFALHKLWPEAIVVYPQGLNTPGRLTDPEGKLPGWQKAKGDQNDRDLKLFDAMLAGLKLDYKVDPKRIYSMGHSNGGAFTYLLWIERGDKLAGIAPCAAAAILGDIKPMPVFHVAGEDDKLVKFAMQTRTIDRVRKLNECGEGKPWHDEKWCTIYPSERGAPLVTCIHPGGHELPDSVPPLIVKFFKELPPKP